MQPDDWQTLTKNAADLLRQGHAERALAQMQRAVRLAPRERSVRYWLANACRMTGETARALTLFRDLLAEQPDDLETSFALAFLLRDSGAPGDAAEALLRASHQPGVSLEQLLQITGFLRDSNQFAAAIDVCERAVERDSRQGGLHYRLARLYQATGAFDKALTALRLTLDLAPSTGPAWTALAQQQHFQTADDADFQRIQTAAQQSHGREADMCIAFACGKALDDLGRWPEAWVQYTKANGLMSLAAQWDGQGWLNFVERAAAYPAAAPAGDNTAGQNAIFVVGMPRSGTTLLEQLLDRHPRITGRGEQNFLAHFAQRLSRPLTVSQRQEVAGILWTQLQLDGPRNGLYIDKNPLNFRYVDLLFDCLPAATVLHVTRDGRDSCLSCFFQAFQHPDTAFSYDLELLLDYYRGYRQLMAALEQRYPERIHRVSYESLVAAGGEVLAGVLRFLDVPWDDALLKAGGNNRLVRTASVWQARQPVHSRSVGRWQHYYDFAPDFFDRLAAIDARYTDANDTGAG